MGRIHAAIFVSVVGGCYFEPSVSGRTGDAGADDGGADDDDGGGPTGLAEVSVDQNQGRTFSNREYVLDFATNQSLLPKTFTFTGDTFNWFDATSNYKEFNMGMTFATDFVLSAGNNVTANGIVDPPAIREEGKARAVYELTYDVPSPCNGIQLVNNTSRFAMYPDGRLVRHDVVNWTQSCDNQVFGSFQAFQLLDDSIIKIKRGDAAEETLTAATFTTARQAQHGEGGYGCIQQGGHAIGATWTIAGITEYDFYELAPTPQEMDSGGTKGIVLDYLFEETTQVVAGTYVSNTIVAARKAATCDQLVADVLTPYQTHIVVDMATWKPEWGAYQMAGEEIIANAGLPAGFVLMRTGEAVPTTVMRISGNPSRNGTMLQLDVDYRGQVNNSEIVLWFKDGLDAGEHLVVSQT